MMDDEIDDLLNKAGSAPREVDPRVLDRIAESIRPATHPVRTLPSPILWAVALVAICVAVAVTGAAKLGLAGIHNLSAVQRVVIFVSLAAILWPAALSCVAELIPGRRRYITPTQLLTFGSLILIAAFAAVFRSYATEQFLSQGIRCLTAGLAHAAVAALGFWILLRRGFAVDPTAAGLAIGTLAGLAGVVMLELHCANFEAPHVMLWHTAVIWVAAAAAMVSVRMWRDR
jgi:hypothetical protein